MVRLLQNKRRKYLKVNTIIGKDVSTTSTNHGLVSVTSLKHHMSWVGKVIVRHVHLVPNYDNNKNLKRKALYANYYSN